MRRSTPLAALLLLFAGSAAAAPPTKRECIDANAQAQIELRAGRLTAAKGLLERCEVQACPGPVRTDCATRLEELAPRIPSVILVAKDWQKHDLAAVRVTMDGALLAERLDGRALEVDPGEHSFVFAVPGAAPVTETVVVREREQGRRIAVVLGSAPPASAATAAPPGDPGRTRRIVGITTATVGLAGIVVGGVLGGLASSAWSDAKALCHEGSCFQRSLASDDRSRALQLATGSTIAFVAGGLLTAGGVVLYLTAPRASRTVGVVPQPAGAALVGRF